MDNAIDNQMIIIDNFATASLETLTLPHHTNKKSVLDSSCNFSIKGENEVQELDNTLMRVESKAVSPLPIASSHPPLVSDNKVIVYNIEDDYLIPMLMFSNISPNENMIRLVNTFTNKDFVLNKNDLFLQKTDSFNKCPNIADLNTPNELNVLRSIQLNFQERKHYIHINDIFISFTLQDNHNYILDNTTAYFIHELISIHRDLPVFTIVKKTNDIKFMSHSQTAKNECLHCFYSVLLYKSLSSFHAYRTIISTMFVLLDKLNDKLFLQITLSTSNSSNAKAKTKTKSHSLHFNTIPFFSSFTISNYFYSKSICFKNEESHTKYTKVNANAENDIRTQIIPSYSKHFVPIIQNLCNYNADIINVIYNLLEIANCVFIFSDVFKLVLFGYLLFTIKKYVNACNSNSSSIGAVSKHNLVFYSNIVLLNALKYVFDFISLNVVPENNSNHNTRHELGTFSVLYMFDMLPSEENELLNEIIFQRNNTYKNQCTSSSSSSLSKFLLSNYNDHVFKFKNSLTSNDKKLINTYESCFTFHFIYKFYNESLSKKKLKDLLFSNIAQSFNILSHSESTAHKTNQFWFHAINSYGNEFFAQDEVILNFLQHNKLIEYSKLYHNNYFIELSYKQFFYHFLPILTDIDTKYEDSKSYETAITNFINDLHSYQHITENFYVNDTSKLVCLRYNTFYTLVQLLKAVKDEHAVMVQKHVRMFFIKKLIQKLKHNVKSIQTAYKLYSYRKLIHLGVDELANFIMNKYKKKDTVLIKFILEIQRSNQKLLNENMQLRKKISMVNSNRNMSASNKSGSKRKSDKARRLLNGKSEQNSFSVNSVNTSSSISGRSSVSYFNHSVNKSGINNNNSYNKPNAPGSNNNNTTSSGEIALLKEKLNNSKKKYKDLLTVASQYEKKMDMFIKLINSKSEIKEVLAKNGIQFN